MLLAAAAAAALALAPNLGWELGTVWTGESAYNLVRVVRYGRMMLMLNDGRSAHTVRQARGPWTGYYYDAFALGPVLVTTGRALVLGMGGGTSIAMLRAAAPAIIIDAVEIDPVVVAAAARWFTLDLSDPLLAVHTADARPWLAGDSGVYGIVQVDLYQGGPYIPFYLATREFFDSVRGHMAPHGVLMMNAFDPSPEHVLLTPVVATLETVFRSVLVAPLASGNCIVVAFPDSRTIDAVQRRLRDPALLEPLRAVASEFADRLISFRPAADKAVFTDDRAAVEELTRRALIVAPGG